LFYFAVKLGRIFHPEIREKKMSNLLEKEFHYYLNNQDELVKEYNGRFIVIKDSKVIGDYGDPGTAVKETSKKHERGTFLVQKCSPGKDDYTQSFHSRVA